MGRGLFYRLGLAADLPDETLPGMSLIEIAGDRRVLVERHRGVTEYSPCSIRVKVPFGEILVEGSGLELDQMTQGQLIISGCIQGVRLFRREK